LVIAPHPDDETLGCGGIILRHINNGDQVYWLIATDTEDRRLYTNDYIDKRKTIINKVNRAYGFAGMRSLGIPAGRMFSAPFDKLVCDLKAYFNEMQHEIIYFPYCYDIHTDHQILSKAVWSASKAFRCGSIKKTLMYETISETDYSPIVAAKGFTPNVFADVSGFIDKKLEIAKLYETEILPTPFPRSLENIRALARYRGGSANIDYAEAFILAKEIIN
jgi:LmbE family N-acetylglucosaminyl deacetylase